jgi:hypothetical protein
MWFSLQMLRMARQWCHMARAAKRHGSARGHNVESLNKKTSNALSQPLSNQQECCKVTTTQ